MYMYNVHVTILWHSVVEILTLVFQKQMRDQI